MLLKTGCTPIWVFVLNKTNMVLCNASTSSGLDLEHAKGQLSHLTGIYWDIDPAPDTAVSELLDNEDSARKPRQEMTFRVI